MRKLKMVSCLFLLVLFLGGFGSVFAAGTEVIQLPSIFPTADMTYYGRWTANPSVIVFDAGGGTGVSNLTGVTAGATGVSAPPTPSKTGYAFGGWYDNAGFSGSAITTIPALYPPGGVIYYAKWSAIPFQVIFESNGGSEVLLQNRSVDDNRLTVPASPERDGYTFTGWYKDVGLTQSWNFDTDTVGSTTTL